ncbi:MAG: ribonuclease HII [Parachlamydiaceae bacterium]|nr:ribonuclease HII [Parachlamydiaceae bacterium]
MDLEERNRLKCLTMFEKSVRKKGYKLVAGIDEVGRGPLAGPVVAAACLLPHGLLIDGVDDSKKLTPEKREEIYHRLTGNKRVIFGIGIVSPAEIDRINILQATIAAMLLAISNLSQIPDYLLVDGLALPHPTIPCLKIIKGDELSQSIAAASVIAKVTRDRLMFNYHEQWPEYGFDSHKGYGTSRHVDAIYQHGPCSIHRSSFEPIKSLHLSKNQT